MGSRLFVPVGKLREGNAGFGGPAGAVRAAAGVAAAAVVNAVLLGRRSGSTGWRRPGWKSRALPGWSKVAGMLAVLPGAAAHDAQLATGLDLASVVMGFFLGFLTAALLGLAVALVYFWSLRQPQAVATATVAPARGPSPPAETPAAMAGGL